MKTKHIVCYSGGHSSGLVAIEVVRKFGKENVILLNHDINSNVEDADIKRFKKEVADYLELPITYKNYNDLPIDLMPDQFDVVEIENSFINPHTRQALCTSILKTVPLSLYLESQFPNKNAVLYYGFDESEQERVERREVILKQMGFNSDYPLALWGNSVEKYNDFIINGLLKSHNVVNQTKIKLQDFKNNFKEFIELAKNFGLIELKEISDKKRTIFSTKEIGIEPPMTYNVFKHANCTGCLKAGQQHWYCVYVHANQIFERAKLSEKRIGYSIINGFFLKDLECKFKKMKEAGVEANEHTPFQTFWANAKKFIKQLELDEKPCECSF